MKQQQLPFITDFEYLTACQLMSGEPSSKAIDAAIVLVKKWNDKRVKLGLSIWE